jgi:hypothetical protein
LGKPPGVGGPHLVLANAYRVLGRASDQSRALKLFRELEALKRR